MKSRISSALGSVLLIVGCAGPGASPSASLVHSGPSAQPSAASVGPSAPATSSWEPTGLGFDADGNLLVTDCIGGHLYRVDPSGAASQIAGTGVSTTSGGLSGEEVPATEADLHCPADATADVANNILVVDHANNRIRLIESGGMIRTIIGSGPIGTGSDDGNLAGDGGQALAATLQEPWGIVFDDDGNLFIADRDNHAIRKVDPTGVITTVAGSGDRGFSGDGDPAIEADLSRPQSVAIDREGNVYFSDSDNHVIRRVGVDGVITSIAGTGEAGYSGDGGLATAATIIDPNGLVFDLQGNLYFVDDSANVVRRIGADGVITTVAGTGEAGFAGDGGPGTAAALSAAGDIIFDEVGNLYIADAGNHRIRVLHPDGTIDTFSTGLP